MAGPLAAKIRAKYPGAYDGIDDATLEKQVLAKYPQYAKLAEPEPAKTEGRSWADTAVDALPALGGAAGGIIGGIGGTAFGMGVGGVPGAVGGATLGGGAGEAAKQLINRARGKEAPGSATEAATGIGKEAAIQGAAEGVGIGTGRILTKGARRLYQSALKPGLDVTKGSAARLAEVITTGLEEGINPTARGSGKIGRIVTGIQNKVKPLIQAAGQRGQRIDRVGVAREAEDFAKGQFAGLAPKADHAAIEGVVDEFVAGAPSRVDEAFEAAQREGSLLRKTFGQRGGADVEARKALQHGTRQAVGRAVPEINPLLTRESKLHRLGKAVNRRAHIGANADPLSFAAIAPNMTQAALWLANRIPALKSQVARGAYQAGKHPRAIANSLRASIYALLGGDDE